MKLTNIFSFILLFIMSVAQASSSSYILTFSKYNIDEVVPASFVETVKSLLTGFGGKITHEYVLIKGFTVDLPSDVIPTLKKKLSLIGKEFEYNFNLEKDSEVHAFKSHDI